MAAIKWLVLHSPVFLFLFILAIQGDQTPNDQNNDVSEWCNTTPNPQQCIFHLSHLPNSPIVIQTKQDFLKLSMEIALEHTMDTHKNAYTLGSRCQSQAEKAAWFDCLELYNYAIQHLNTTINPNKKCTQGDIQTWLSSALTNVETCQEGFIDFKVTTNLMPIMAANNVSSLICNTLAINNLQGNETTKSSSGHLQGRKLKDGFPRWVKPGDRKLLQSTSTTTAASFVVAQDGSGTHTTINDALVAASKANSVKSGRQVIHIKAGVYDEQVQVKSSDITWVGDGIGKTVITGSRSVGGGTTTYKSATVAVTGSNFIAKGVTFRNTAGSSNDQAVALRADSDLSVFYECSFEGYQDTLYVHSNRQFFRDSNIYGTVDFIFGNSAAVFQNCNIYPRYHQVNTLTAQGRTDPNQNTGISIQNCKVLPSPELQGKTNEVKTYLGRPWKQYSRTVFMQTYLDGIVDSAGWYPWDGNFALSTLYYGEYDNTGPGSSTSGRVNWAGYHVITSPTVASKFTAANFIGGNSWLPSTDVPFDSGLV